MTFNFKSIICILSAELCFHIAEVKSENSRGSPDPEMYQINVEVIYIQILVTQSQGEET